MSGPLDIYEPALPTPVRGVEAPPPEPVGPQPSLGEIFTAARTVQQVDNSDYLDTLSNRELGPILEQINRVRRAEGLLGFAPPSMGMLPAGKIPQGNVSAFGQSGAMVGREAVEDAIFAELRRIRQQQPDFLKDVASDRATFWAPILKRERGTRDAAQGVVDRGRGFAAGAASFTGSVTKSLEDPINIWTLPVGGAGKTIAVRVVSEMGANALLELIQQPTVAKNRGELGLDLTAGEAAANVVGAAIGAGALQLVGEGAAKLGSDLVQRLNPLEKKLASALANADLVNPTAAELDIIRTVLADEDPRLVVDLLKASRGGDLSPSEQAAVAELERHQEIDDANPYAPVGDGYPRFEDDLSRALDRAIAGLPGDGGAAARQAAGAELGGPPATSSAPRAMPVDGSARDVLKAKIRRAESSGNDTAKNERSSASGRYQFTEETFVSYYRKVYGGAGVSDGAIWRQRMDPDIQERLMDALVSDNAALLRRAGQSETAGNLYLVHFLGPRALDVLRAAPGTPVAKLLPPDFLSANPTVLPGKSASEVIAWAHRKMGGQAASVSIAGDVGGEIDAGAVLRADALRLRQEAAGLQGMPPIEAARFRPDEIESDAALMQFKQGGDAEGVTERLQGVSTWNSILAGRAIVWEALSGRRVIADGHQRLGLAKRIAAADPSQNVELDALVLREAAGWDAESVRVWAALKNVAEGSGSVVDAAKVMRGMGVEEARAHLPPRSALVRDAEGVARLGDDAFGMVVNELVDPGQASIVGRLARDPGEQQALLGLLMQLQPTTRGEAESVVRQAMAAGFTRETQEDMFGALDLTSSRFLERARILDRGMAELRKLRQVHSTAAANKDMLEASGETRIDRDAAQQEASDNATAIDLIGRLAHSAGPVKRALDAAVEQLAGGGRIGDAVKRFVGDIRQLDLAELARSGGDAGDGLDVHGSGRFGDAGEADGELPAGRGYPEQPDLADNAWPSRAALDSEIERGHAPLDSRTTDMFADPHGAGPKLQADSLEHDLRAELDPAIAERERQLLDLAAGSPMRASVDQESMIGASLFDAVDQGDMLRQIAATPDLPAFVIDGEERTLGDLLDRFDRDAAAIAAARKCL